ncbi:ABC transporter ATP-binding protein [Candidatus Saccharibacteria bacterium]|nr:ABC transporter ATP-binding protein [Candidatus Saccharibacteria bacterium]
MTDQQKNAIEVTNLYKSFKLPHEQHSGIKQLILNFFRRKKGYELQRVLNDISFDIKEGEFFGIVGRNGSGKSTLLKLLAGIYAPDAGHIQVNGSLIPFIELGVGFNPELTGRENVFLNGALLGFSHGEMEGMYDEIVKFAEIEKFMDQKLKNYSSGMQVRLAFSIATRAKSDILLIDEVLAVGDENFQRKCMQYFAQLKRDKQTIVFITHDMAQVRRFCDRALYIDNGEIIKISNTNEITNIYTEKNLDGDDPDGPKAEELPKNLRAEYPNGSSVKSGDTISVVFEWDHNSAVKNVGAALIKDTGEFVFATNTILDNFTVNGNSVEYNIECNLIPGKYSFAVGLFGETDLDIITYTENFTTITVRPADERHKWDGITKLEHSWR